LSSQVLAEPATSPPLQSLTLLNQSLPWELTIRPTSSVTPFVTVQDVLHGVYRFLRLSVNSAEYSMLPSKDHQMRVNLAYHARCNRSPSKDIYDEESKKGVKRVDFLMGQNKLMGLSSTKRGPDVWVLNV
ncbi:hypothetical protein SERLA73DRAFT_27426, partial [Serpula lacrymans var. lacrymans S7.3]